MRIIFMGTPDFAVESLKRLTENGEEIVAVVTSPDKPAGRGQKLRTSAVKQYALAQGLPLLQPINLKAPEFIERLKALNADLQLVVAFRMLPELVWAMPALGTINLHASLLPQYRGAAPINWAIINGEKKTGVSTFFISHDIDTGHIIDQRAIEILPTETAGSLHDKLMSIGADLLLKTVQQIRQQSYSSRPQKDLIAEGEKLKMAPKLTKAGTKIDWQKSPQAIDAFIRGLNPYPAAWTAFLSKANNKTVSLKVFKAEPINQNHNHIPGCWETDGKNYLQIAVKKGFIRLLDLQLAGKKRMDIAVFLRGFQADNYHNHIK